MLRAALLGSFLWVLKDFSRSAMKDCSTASPAVVPGVAHSTSATERSTCRLE